MDLIKKLTGKNPDEYEMVAKLLVEEPNVELFAKLVRQDDFLFDFIKNNVAIRVKRACNKENYLNLLKFFDYYSPSYDYMIAETLYHFGGLELLPAIKEMLINGTNAQKCYALKFISLLPNDIILESISFVRKLAYSNDENLSLNAIEILSKVSDLEFKNKALELLNSKDEFEQYNGVKYLVSYKAKDALSEILKVMKKSSLSENIASEIPYLVPIEQLVETEDGILILCNIINAIPEIIPTSSVLDYNLFSIFENLYINNLSSASAVLLRLAQDKFNELTSNDEYLFDVDKNTKDEVFAIKELLGGINANKLKSLLYDELYEESDFVMFAIDFVDEKEELEILLDTTNPTMALKVLYRLKEIGKLENKHKETTLTKDFSKSIKSCVEAL